MSISVVIVDDHAMVRQGLSNLLKGSDISIVAEASSVKEAVEESTKYKPDVVLLDLKMNDEGGLEALTKIRKKSPDSKVVILSTFDNPTYVARAVARGAVDYLLKGLDRNALISAIIAAAEGRAPSKSGAMRDIAVSMSSRELVGEDLPLTSRESQVLRHIAFGLSNREIASSLNISVETVKEHVQNILRKIDATDRTQAAVWAVRKQLV